VRVQGVEIAAGGQDIASTPGDDAGRAGFKVAAVHPVQKRLQFVGKQSSSPHLVNLGLNRLSQLEIAAAILLGETGREREQALDEWSALLEVGGAGLSCLPVYHLLQRCLVQRRRFRVFGQQGFHQAAQRVRGVVVADDGVDELSQALPRRDLAEDVHPFGDVGILEERESLMSRLHHLVESGSRRRLDHAFQVPLAQPGFDQVFYRMRLARFQVLQFLVLGEQPFNFFEIAVEFSLDHHCLHVIHQRAVTASLGDGALGRIVSIVEIEVRHFVDACIGKAAAREAGGLAGEKFEIAVRADVNDGVGTELPRKPLVGGQVLVGRRYFRIMEDLTDPAVTASSGTAAFGLHAHHRIAEIHPRDQEFALVEHCGWNAVPFLARRLAPGLDHTPAGGLGQFLKPRQVALFLQRDQRPSFRGDFIGGGPPELGKGLTAENGINEGFAVFRWCHQIACLLHPLEDVGHAFEGIQMGASANRGFHGGARVVVQDEGNLLVAVGLARQLHPAGHAGGQAFHAVGNGGVGFFFRMAEAACRSHNERLDNPLKLGQRHAPRHLLAQSLRVFQPGLLVFVVGNDRTHERHVEPTE